GGGHALVQGNRRQAREAARAQVIAHPPHQPALWRADAAAGRARRREVAAARLPLPNAATSPGSEGLMAEPLPYQPRVATEQGAHEALEALLKTLHASGTLRV